MKYFFLLILLVASAGGGYFFGRGGTLEDAQSWLGEVTQQKGSIPTGQDSTEMTPDAIITPVPTADITTGIVHVWKSVDDPKFTREFERDATVVDRYEGDEAATSKGLWTLLVSPMSEPPPFPVQEGVSYIKLSFAEEVLYFSVGKLTETELELVYLDGGEVLRFTKAE